jgi:hypothetical protein
MRIGVIALVPVLSGPVFVQGRGPQQNGALSSATLLPLSGVQNQTGSVGASQSTTNAGGGNSVNLLNSNVNVQGQYSGSEPSGTNTGTILPLTLDYALTLALRYNVRAVSQGNAMLQAEGMRRVARSAQFLIWTAPSARTASKSICGPSAFPPPDSLRWLVPSITLTPEWPA